MKPKGAEHIALVKGDITTPEPVCLWFPRLARYIGGELGASREGYHPRKANICLTFPDAYEVGMSHQGIRLLYTLAAA